MICLDELKVYVEVLMFIEVYSCFVGLFSNFISWGDKLDGVCERVKEKLVEVKFILIIVLEIEFGIGIVKCRYFVFCV